ncbi:MAG: LysE family transporter [Anaerolineae bacterium]|nr:LysE family transporter [Anaerolineae bacterium]
MIAMLLQGISYGYAAGITPGPLQTFLLMQTLQYGWRRAIWIVLGPLISDGPVVALILLVLQRASDDFLRVMGVVGGVFVLYIAWGLLRQLRSGELNIVPEDSAAAGESVPAPWAAIRKAAAINVLGPGPWLFWGTAMGPLAISAWRESRPTAVLFVAGFYVTFLLVMVTQVLVVHQARRLGPRVVRVALWIGFTALVVFALRLFWGALGGG